MSEQPRRYRRRPIQSRAEETVSRILDAAAQVLDEGGIDSLSTNRIAERSGINISVLYRYFRNKFEILEALSGRTQGRIRDAIESAAKDAAPTSIQAALQIFVEALDREPGADALARSTLSLPELREVHETNRSNLVDVVTSLFATAFDVEVPTARARLAAWTIVHAASSVLMETNSLPMNKRQVHVAELATMLEAYLDRLREEHRGSVSA